MGYHQTVSISRHIVLQLWPGVVRAYPGVFWTLIVMKMLYAVAIVSVGYLLTYRIFGLAKK